MQSGLSSTSWRDRATTNHPVTLHREPVDDVRYMSCVNVPLEREYIDRLETRHVEDSSSRLTHALTHLRVEFDSLDEVASEHELVALSHELVVVGHVSLADRFHA